MVNHHLVSGSDVSSSLSVAAELGRETRIRQSHAVSPSIRERYDQRSIHWFERWRLSFETLQKTFSKRGDVRTL